MTTYTFANMSGSVGKTTTAASLSIPLAAEGLRVRVIDLDPQANLSTLMGYPATSGITSADVLRDNVSIADAERPARIRAYIDEETAQPVYTGDPEHEISNLTVVPASRNTLDKVTVELTGAGIGGFTRLHEALDAADPVDVTFIDCPGTNNALVTNALIATSVDEEKPAGSWGVITCIKPAGKEAEGLQTLMQELSIIKKTFRISIPLQAIVPCAVSSRAGVHAEQLNDLRDTFGDKVTPAVRRGTIVDEAYTKYLPVPLVGHRAKDINEDYTKVLKHLKQLGLFRRAAINA